VPINAINSCNSLLSWTIKNWLACFSGGVGKRSILRSYRSSFLFHTPSWVYRLWLSLEEQHLLIDKSMVYFFDALKVSLVVLTIHGLFLIGSSFTASRLETLTSILMISWKLNVPVERSGYQLSVPCPCNHCVCHRVSHLFLFSPGWSDSVFHFMWSWLLPAFSYVSPHFSSSLNY